MSDARSSPEVVTMGEALIVFDPEKAGALRHVGNFGKSVGGAELNVAVALSRLGHRAAWTGALGDDEFGEEILSLLRAEGVESSSVLRNPDAPTGIYFKERRALGDTRVYYYRSGSAASRTTFDDLDVDYLLCGEILHLTGITPCLSEGCREMTGRIMSLARERDVTVSFDANVRKALLGGREPGDILHPLMELADIVFLSDEEARTLLGSDDEETVAGYAGSIPASHVIVHSEGGALCAGSSGTLRSPSFGVEVEDTVGAGDAFVAGFLSGMLRGLDVSESLRLANACGACAVTVPGDARSMPFEDDVLSLVRGLGEAGR